MGPGPRPTHRLIPRGAAELRTPLQGSPILSWPAGPVRAYSFSMSTWLRSLVILSGSVVGLGLGPPSPLDAQAVPEEVRIGISFGGISFMGLVSEYRWGDRSVELNVGTWSFRDLSVSLVGKQYFGPGDFRPFAGFGLWTVVAPYHDQGERTGMALMLRAPIGVDWNPDAGHYLGAHLSLNRAVWIRRQDPQDDYPPADRLVPLPGFYYLWNR